MDELKAMRIWVCWNMTTDKKGRKTKTPCAANGGPTGTDMAHAHTWVTFAEAMMADIENDYSGVGFVVPRGYFFLDVDHRAEDDPLVKTLLTRFGAYAERSCSGSGLHMYGKCAYERLPIVKDDQGRDRLARRYYTKNPGNGLELYLGGLTNRFAVFTGDAVQFPTADDCTQAILETLESDMKRKPGLSTTEAESLDDAKYTDIIEKLRTDKNGMKFSRLFDDGDITGFTSQSEADASLCAMIAFRAGKNHSIIDAIFRQSALYRAEKWERPDYRESTISCGIEACHDTFHYSVRERPDFIIYNIFQKTEEVVCTLLARYFRERVHYAFVRDTSRNSVLRYIYEHGVYRLYSDDMIKGLIKGFVMEYDEQLVHMPQINEVFAQLITDNVFVPMDALNADENLINFENGLLRLSDLSLLPHTPDILSTIRIPCNWSGIPCATPVFDSYLNELVNGDRAYIALSLQFIGACLSNIKCWRMKKSPFFYGPGDTGKSVMRSLVERLLGKGNYASIDLAELEARFGTGNLYGKRLAGSSDMSFMTVNELKSFKKLTGGDSVFAEFKGQNGFEFVYDGLLWFCMNRLPKFGGDDGSWVYERITPIECRNVISADQQDKKLLDKLYNERDGIVYKAIMALKDVIANGYRFAEPVQVIDARKAYQEVNNTVLAFFHECIVARPGGKIKDQCTTSRVYAVYVAWCKDNNHGYAKTAKEFREGLASYLNTSVSDMTVRRKIGIYYEHYTLSDAAKDAYSKAYGYDPTYSHPYGVETG